MKIQEFARRTGLSTHTLRYYEEINLLHVERDGSGHRNYSSRDIKWVHCIKRLKEANMPLKELQQFASLRHTCAGPECPRLGVLERHRDSLVRLHDEILQQIDIITKEIDLYKEWNGL